MRKFFVFSYAIKSSSVKLGLGIYTNKHSLLLNEKSHDLRSNKKSTA